MSGESLSQFAKDIASVLPEVDSKTEGQYGSGIGSEDEEDQLDLILRKLQCYGKYEGVKREVEYPTEEQKCDIVLSDGTPIEAKLLRYWRANGDPEETIYKHIFSPFNKNTLLTDSKRLYNSEFQKPCGILGIFYKRSEMDDEEVEELPGKFTADQLAQKVVEDIDYWYEFQAEISNIVDFEGLRHRIHKQGSVITWEVG